MKWNDIITSHLRIFLNWSLATKSELEFKNTISYDGSNISQFYCELFFFIYILHSMLNKKRQNLADQANKLRGGIFKIDDTQAKVNEMAAELEITQEQVQTSTRECEEFLITIGNSSMSLILFILINLFNL